MRGDVPKTRYRVSKGSEFSPRARGCSSGVLMLHHNLVSFPRVRGDVPACGGIAAWTSLFSPRARGCSAHLRGGCAPEKVFPACAGMFLSKCLLLIVMGCFPRVRGDVPTMATFEKMNRAFSPRARGCSGSGSRLEIRSRVFPACAGMFRPVHALLGTASCFPRVRGDVPSRVSMSNWRSEFSPRARGCSVHPEWCSAG